MEEDYINSILFYEDNTPTNVVDGTGNIKNYSMKEEEE